MIKILLTTVILLNTIISEILYEQGELKEFIGGDCPSCLYDNFINHTSEGIAQNGYNIYAPEYLDIQNNDFGDYKILESNSETLNYWKTIFENFLARDYNQVDLLLSDSLTSFNYHITEFNDTTLNRTFYMLREYLDSSYYDSNRVEIPDDDIIGSFRNGWGLYIINPEALNKEVIVEVPHPNDDFISPYVSTELFIETNAFAMMIAGAGREKKWTEQGSYNNDKSLSDPSRNSNSVFHVFHEVLSDSLVNFGPHSPMVFHMHSFDENQSHQNFNSVIISGGHDAEFANKPIRDISDNHFDIINFTQELPIEENFFNSITGHPPVTIDKYYQVHYDSSFYYYGFEDTITIPHAYELIGPTSAVQMSYLRNYFPNHQVYEPWIQIECDEKPEIFNQYNIDNETLYSNDLPVTYRNYNHLIEYYRPFINGVKDYLENWRISDVTPPTTPNNLKTIFDGDHYVELNWDKTDDTNFKTYKITYDNMELNDSSYSIDYLTHPQLGDLRFNSIILDNLISGDDYTFSIESIDYFNNISNTSNVANDTVIGHQPISIIENFENGSLELNSYIGQDEDSEDWSIDSLNTFLNSKKSLKLFGNTWKSQNIGPINVEENSIWQISSYCEDKGEIIGVAFQDSLNTLFYSFYGSQELNIEEWVTVYQGSQPENQWNIFKLPIGDDWFAYFDYYPQIESFIYINDKDQNSIESISYFDDLLDITNSITFAPSITINYEITNSNRTLNSRDISINFEAIVIDSDSYNFDYFWYFGDGTFSNIQNPNHTYSIQDDHTYNIILQVTDETGNISYATQSIDMELGDTTLPFTINFVGDIMLGRAYDNTNGIIDQYGVESIFEPTKAFLGDNADITVANLECPLTIDGPAHPTKSVVFKARPENVQGLLYAGIDVVSLANNHTLDFGLEGLVNTQNVLNDAGILFSGAGANSIEAYEPIIYNKNGINLAFLASSDRTGQYNNYQPYLHAGYNKPGFAYMTPYYLLQQLEYVENISDLSIVEMHAGSEYSIEPGADYDNIISNLVENQNFYCPNENIYSMDQSDFSNEDENYIPFLDVPHMWDREIRHFAIDNGADIVIVHHPHILQGFEVYNGKLIAHSLGNFVFDLSYPETFPTAILNAKVDTERFYDFEVKPVYINNYIPLIAEGELGIHILDYIAHKSRQLNTFMHTDKNNLKGEIILDEININPFNITSKININSYQQDDFNYSEVIPIKKFGNIKSIDSLSSNYEYRLGRELIWFGNMEDEGCDLWNINNANEFFDNENSFSLDRSICHVRTSNSSDNIVTNLKRRIRIDEDKDHGIFGYIKSNNSSNSTLEIRYYSGRTSSLSLGTDGLEDQINGTNDWKKVYTNTTPPNGSNFFDLRLNSGIPDSDTSKTWYDDISIIEWSDWNNGNNFDSLFTPNDYYFMQIRTDANQSFDNIIFSETNYGQAESVSPNFSYFQQTFTEPSEIKFFNQSNGMTGWYFWDFGDGNTSIEQNPSHTYTDLGPYTVSLTVLDYNNNQLSEIKNDIISFNENIILGDMNFDQNLNVLDIILLVNQALSNQGSGLIQYVGDLDSNGQIDILDIVLLVNIILN